MGVRNRTYWIVSMLFLGTAYMLVNWINFVDLSAARSHRGLLIGPMSWMLWISLLSFTFLGTVVYVLESANTVSYLFSGGSTQLPLYYEQLLTILLVHIPIAALNFFIASCRADYTSTFQTLSGAFSMVFVFVRMLWLAHIEGHQEEIAEKTKLLFMVACTLYAIAMAFPIMMWRERKEPEMKRLPNYMNTSMYLLNEEKLYEKLGEHLHYHNVTEYGSKPQNPILGFKVAELNMIGSPNKSDKIFNVTIPCNDSYQDVPECRNMASLKFRFHFKYRTPDGPIGQLKYGYAPVPRDTSEELVCTSRNTSLSAGWDFHFFIAVKTKYLNGTEELEMWPWQTTCLRPKAILAINPPIDLC